MVEDDPLTVVEDLVASLLLTAALEEELLTALFDRLFALALVTFWNLGAGLCVLW